MTFSDSICGWNNYELKSWTLGAWICTAITTLPLSPSLALSLPPSEGMAEQG